MANLIIKPAGNGSLILQDEGGDAAVTVGTTGSATFAQSVVLSGTTNNIGTVTVGNLSNTAIVYPAGHVVQTVATVYHDAGNNTSATAMGQRVSSLDHQITPLFANSDILIEANFAAYSSSPYGIYDFYKNASDVTETYNLSGEAYGIAPHTGQTKWFHHHMAYLDNCPENSTSQKTYGLSYWGSASGTTYCGWGNGSVITVIAKEIKR